MRIERRIRRGRGARRGGGVRRRQCLTVNLYHIHIYVHYTVPLKPFTVKERSSKSMRVGVKRTCGNVTYVECREMENREVTE